MFSNEHYKCKKFALVDIYDGIIMWLYFFLIVKIILCFNNFLITEIYYTLISIIIVEGIINIFKLLFCLFYDGLNKDYTEIKIYIILIPWVISLPLMGFSIFILITKIDEDFHALCALLSYNVISLFRIINFILFINKT
jgi:hypothetical protein